MKHDEVIALAREAGLLPDNSHPRVQTRYMADKEAMLARFATIIEARLMERLLAGAGEPFAYNYVGHFGFSPGVHPNERPLYTADQTAAAVLREREECAKVCVPMPGFKYSPNYLGGITQCAEAIRARGNTT